MKIRSIMLAFTACAFVCLAACDGVPDEAEKQAVQQARIEAAAQKQLENYHQLKATGRADLALNIADHVLRNFPQTQAAAAIRPDMDALRAQVSDERRMQQLKALWVYHDENDAKAGGRVRSAYIFAKDLLGPAENGEPAPRGRLVLRRHPQWGDDVYLLSERGPFTCTSPCRLVVHFDGAAPRTVDGEIPETGEHAIFVKDFSHFAANLPGAQVVRIETTLKEAGPVTMEFEVGGYDPQTIGTR